MSKTQPLDLSRLRVQPLDQRRSLSTVESILVDPASAPKPISEEASRTVQACVASIVAARKRGASVMLIYGAHLLRNGAALLLTQMMEQGLITHLATNGAGTIHDWEYSWLGRSTESVEQNVATGTFGTWDETGRNLHLALLGGNLNSEGYGGALGKYIISDGATFPDPAAVREMIVSDPTHPLTAARAEWLGVAAKLGLRGGRHEVVHQWKHASILAQAARLGVPLTVHPGIGYDIISNHPLFDGAVIGRAATTDFCKFGAAVENLDGGVVLSVGSAIMGPQVFEKSLSCVNNIRLQEGRPTVTGHTIYVVDLQDGGGWDWTQGEPPKSNPAYYLRFCKSFSRMAAPMHYLQLDNLAFIHHLHHQLSKS